MRPQKFSRIWPCQVLFPSGWCSGSAVLINGRYECQKCDATWQKDGDNHPTSTPRERTTL